MDTVDTESSPTPLFSSDLERRTVPAEVVLGGARVACWSYEPLRVTPETRTILVIHGFRGDHHGLLRVADQLPEMRLIMPDLPGFGGSAAFEADEHSVERYGRFIAELMAALDLGPETVLLGHSFGSIVAGHFVAANPGAVAGLILINPIAAPALEGAKGLMTKLAILYYEAAARLPRRLGQALLRSRLIVRVMSEAMAKTPDKALRRFVHAQHSAYFSAFANRDSLLEAFKASVGNNVAEVAGRLTLPVLLIAGEQDEIAALADQHKLLALLPDGHLDVIPGVGHLIHYETPEPAAGFIRRFVKDHTA
ncbi:pimeloyl-ACP methyl ester carboxylesterase [Arthrobacter sp. V4I6]|uniref:alpha/beta fold hydrolase n=1 Tax=unclassified Arthrobacter TaxID=235627 RepID=UPI002781B81C|nr:MULTISPECIES: alpha/beta hydrolase [unclassified Arthrobacter]MDQ0820922.1 pimeloyl-ACP methyl ester carboxylesterase [Arthrobacter sp. V1I7]MDQ0855185.1 pimeloyl-ACP methyl ester carboxylesterase [Arthrobacter sp. V4I6]